MVPTAMVPTMGGITAVVLAMVGATTGGTTMGGTAAMVPTMGGTIRSCTAAMVPTMVPTRGGIAATGARAGSAVGLAEVFAKVVVRSSLLQQRLRTAVATMGRAMVAGFLLTEVPARDRWV